MFSNLNTYYFFIMMLLILLLTSVLAQANPPANYYVFAVKRGWHKTTPCDWTIHGLWPEYTPKSWPQFCQPKLYKEYNETQLVHTYPNITKYWPPESLWEHEWKKHGTCTNMTVTEYFGKAISIFEKVRRKKYNLCCNYNDHGCRSQGCKINFNLDFKFKSCA